MQVNSRFREWTSQIDLENCLFYTVMNTPCLRIYLLGSWSGRALGNSLFYHRLTVPENNAVPGVEIVN